MTETHRRSIDVQNTFDTPVRPDELVIARMARNIVALRKTLQLIARSQDVVAIHRLAAIVLDATGPRPKNPAAPPDDAT